MRNTLRKLVVLTVSVGMLCMAAVSAQAGIFLPKSSTITVAFAALPTLNVSGTYQGGGWATVSNNGAGHDMSDTGGIWTTTGLSVGTSLLTGTALISNLSMTAQNGSGSFTASFSAPNPWGGNLTGISATPYSGTLCPDGCLGGLELMTGQFVLHILGTPLAFNADIVGVGGTAILPVGQAQIIATAGPFITGKARLTNITTNVISMPGRGASGLTGVGVTLAPAGTEEVKTFTTLGGFITTNPSGVLETHGTVTLRGINTVASSSQGGVITLVSPLRIQTGPLGVGNIPGAFYKRFSFVPEPGTMLLLVSGAAGLVFIGRKRMKN